MAELARSKRIYSVYIYAVDTAVAGEVHTEVAPAAQWVPPGDVKIIGADLSAMINPLPDADFSKASCYCYSAIGMLPGIGQVNEFLSCYAAQYPVELPTVGEHALNGERYIFHQIMFPYPEGFATNEWHPVYLSISHRNLWAENVEVTGNAHIYFVEL